MNQLYQLLFLCFLALVSFNTLHAELNIEKETLGNESQNTEVDQIIPLLTSPVYFAKYEPTTTQVEFLWSLEDVSTISGFIIEYSVNNVVQTPIEISSVSVTSHTLNGLVSGSRVSWRVGSINNLDEENWSEWSVFFIKRDRKVFVKPDGIGSGANWNDAIGFRAALKNYVYGDTLWMAKGVYKPTSSSDRTLQFALEEGIHIYGGFTGFETKLSQRDWKKNPTILSGNIGDLSSETDNSYNVLSFNGVKIPITNSTRVDGIIVQDGYASLSSGNFNRGGAFKIINASPLIVNVHFKNNYASSFGGAVSAYAGSEPKFYNCLFENNNAAKWGGAVTTEGDTEFVNCVFYGNEALERGGAISGPQFPSHINIYNCILWNNGAPTGDQAYGALNILYSIVEGIESTGNTFNSDPLFVDPSNSDFRINQNSPALNSGKNNYIPDWLTVDFTNSTRITDGVVDMGIYEGVTLVPEIDFPENMHVIDHSSLSVDLIWNWSPGESFSGYVIEYKVNDEPSVMISAGINSEFTFTDIQPATEIKWRVGSKKDDDELTLWSGWSNFIVNRDTPLFVKSGATGSGVSWQDAMSLHSAMEAAVYGDEVWVAAGTYKPTTTTDRYTTFNLREGIKLYGGFSGTENSLDQRNFLINPTIFSGNIGASGVESDNSYNVFRIVGTAQNPITNATVMDGIYVQDGYANNSTGDRDNGGGIYISHANPIISNVWFRFNYAKGKGGAIYSDNFSQPTFGNVIFSDNTSLYLGGAVYTDSDAEFYNCVWYKNNSRFGGAISCDEPSSKIYNSIFWSNKASDENNDLDYADSKFSIVQDGSGTGSITTNPVLEDPSNGDFSFEGSSSAVDAGSNDYVPDWLTKDFYGNPRIRGASVDIGVFEFNDGTSFVINRYSQISSAMEVWPNPLVRGSELYARLSFQNQNGVFTLTDFSGSILKVWQRNSQGTINLGSLDLPSGLYFVTFKGESGRTFSAKLIVK